MKGGVLVLQDRRRLAFEQFGVKVLPTTGILDGRRRLVTTVSGYPLNFADVVADGLLYAMGRIDREKLEKTLHPHDPVGLDETRLKAVRNARMAAALARRGLLELAMTRFEEARGLDPQLIEARLGLAEVHFEMGRVQEAHGLFEGALAQDGRSVAAHIGLARIEIKRDQLDQAEKRLKDQVALHPLHAELHFLLGEVHERRGKTAEALSAFKRAAHLLLERPAEN